VTGSVATQAARNRRPQQDRSRRTFEALLDAGGLLLAEVGIERISANMVCAKAGVTPPAFYRYFEDKYALIAALAERLMARQNEALVAWVDAWGGAGLDVIADKVIDLMRTMAVITDGQPGSLWIMRAMHAVPTLAPIRLASHNYVADVLTDTYRVYLPHVTRETLRRRVRLSVELAYSIDEMMKEEDVDREQTLEDAHFVFRAMFDYPEYRRQPATLDTSLSTTVDSRSSR